MAIPKPELKQRILKHLERWQVPPHKYQIKMERGKVVVRLLNKYGADEIAFPTTLGPTTVHTKMEALKELIRASEVRQQTDIEDFTEAVG